MFCPSFRSRAVSTGRPRLLLHFARRPLSLAVRCALLGAVTVAAAGASVATRAEAAVSAGRTAAKRFDIAAGPLSAALNQLADQADVLLSVPGAVTSDKNSAGLHGTYRLDEAFDLLLSGTGLQALEQGDGSYTLQAIPTTGAAELSPMTVIGSEPDAIAQRANPATTVGSKTPLSQREIPQSVSVVGQQQIQQQKMKNLDDAMRQSPGVTVSLANPMATDYYARGFPISTFQLDGVPTAIPAGGAATIADNLAMYEQVEVLRGPAGLFNGFGGDGGVVNLVRKQAPAQFQGSAEVLAGSRSTHREQLDVGGPLNDEGSLRGRFVGLTGYGHQMQDGTWQRDQQFYGTLEVDPDPDTTLRTGISHSETTAKPMYGLPGYSDGRLLDVSRSTYLGASWNALSNRRSNAFAEVERQLANEWKAKLTYNYLIIDTHFLNGIPGGPLEPGTNIGNPYSYNYQSEDRQQAVDTYASGPFSLFGREHQLTFGANYLHENTHNTQRFINTETSGLDDWGDYFEDVFSSNPLYSKDFAGGRHNENWTLIEQYGVYGNVRLHLADPLTLVAGGRMTWWHARIKPADAYDNYFGTPPSDTHVKGKFSPIVGLVYALDDTYSAYASYTSIFKPQSGFYTEAGSLIEPVEGKQYELGIKGEYLGGRANASAALFQIDESNRALSDPRFPGYYLAQGKARSQGLELQVSGMLLPGWTLSAGYTYDDVKSLDDSTNAGAPFSMVAPRHLFKLASDYQLPGAWRQWSIGGAAYATSSTGWKDSSGEWNGGGYATLDAHVAYQFLPDWSVGLYGSNILDRKYYQSIAGAAGNYYGEPRTLLASLRTTF